MSHVEYGGVLPIGVWEIDGWVIDIRQGKKSLTDRQIWVASPGGEPHLLSLGALGWIARAWWINEEQLYPTEKSFRGGEIVLDYLRDACHFGPTDAAQRHGLRQPQITKLEQPERKRGTP